MQYIVGAYSQLPYGSSREEYETLLTKQLKPLLTMIYRNSDLKLLFRLSISEYDYLELNHPEVNMLISDLCRKGQMEILSSSYYDVVLSMIPTHERTSEIERTTTYVRKRFSRKPKGLWFFNQIFSPANVPVVNLAGLDYVVISTYNQINGTVEETRPFYTDEMGKQILIFPTDDCLSRQTAELYRGGITLEKYLADAAKHAGEMTSAVSTVMLNMDQLMGTDGSVAIFQTLFDNLGGSCTLPSIYVQENRIGRTHYLPGGLYGRDYQIGKATSINQLIYDDPMLSRHYGVVNMLRDILKNNRKCIDDRKTYENLLMKASSSNLYLPSEYRCPQIRRMTNRNACELEAFLTRMNSSLLPDEIDIDFDRQKESLIQNRMSIAYLSGKGAVLSRFVFTNCLYDIAFHSGKGLFGDSFINDKTGKIMDLSAKSYEITPLDNKKTDYFTKAPQIMLEKVPLSLTKRFKFRQSTVIVEIEIENLSDMKLDEFTYVNTIDISIPVTPGVTCAAGGMGNGERMLTQSVLISDPECPFSVSIVLGEEAVIARDDFDQKTHTWLGDKSFYEYTQLRIQKKLSLGPFEDTRLSIAFRTEKRKEKHNDTNE